MSKKKNVVDIELTEEQQMLLKTAGGIGFTIDNEFKYIPKVFKIKNKKGKYFIPKEFWTVFTLRGIDGVESSEIEDQTNATRVEQADGSFFYKLFSGKARQLTLSKGIVSCKNFRDENNNIIPPPTPHIENDNEIDSDFLRHLSPNLQVELVNAIIERCVLKSDEALSLEL